MYLCLYIFIYAFKKEKQNTDGEMGEKKGKRKALRKEKQLERLIH